MSQLKAQLAAFGEPAAQATLRGILRGVEKESLRVTPDGKLAQTDHPHGLGAAMTHAHITTDFSEALLEFITEPSTSVSAMFGQLDEIHRYTYSQLGSELLWPSSMPCVLGDKPADIPVARYGSSNSATMKTIYRLGLGHRYGRAMQTISGVHYNFSLPDDFWRKLAALEGNRQTLQAFKTDKYFALIRNFRRYFWLLVYLFGAAPAVCPTFVRGRDHVLEPLEGAGKTLHAPYATSLRMGDLGYQSDAQQSLMICYNNLENYLQTLCGAITQPFAPYQAIGVKGPEGDYRQLNTSLLQIENEFYSSVRPKRPARPGETALQALRLRGVEYVEVRCVDLNPFEPLGLSETQVHYLDAFLLYCLMADSPEATDSEYAELQENQKRIVYRGRDASLKLWWGGEEVGMRGWAAQIQAGVAECAALLDDAQDTRAHSEAVTEQNEKLTGERPTPADRMIDQMRRDGMSYYEQTLSLARRHGEHFAGRPLDAERQRYFEALSASSREDLADIERKDTLSFDDYLAQYYDQYRCCEEETDAPATSAQPGC